MHTFFTTMLAFSVSEKVLAITLPHLGRPLTCNFTSHTLVYDLSEYKKHYGNVVGSDYNEPKLPFHKSTENLFDNANECGKPVVDGGTAIMNGHDAPEKAWPWQVLLLSHGLDNETKFCGGSLISESWVLTAAHCILDGPMLLFLGVTDASIFRGEIDPHNSTVQFRRPEKIIAHKGYASHDVDDIALIKLNKAATFDDYVQPICLPKPEQTFENGEDEECYATGWGASNMTHAKGTTVLQQAKINIMPQSMCIFSWKILGQPFDRRILCLDLNDDESGICSGDSGGPLACKIDGRFVLAGVSHVVPAHERCAHTFFPSADVRVTEYLEWISINTEEG